MAEHFTLDYPPDLDDWLDLRAPYFNASMAAALFGEHPYESLGDVVTQKLTGKRVEENAAMRRGTAMEPYIRDVASDILSRKLILPPKLYGCGPMLATLDAIDPDEPEIHVEIKTTTDWIGADAPRYWYWQAIAQMGCYGSRRVIFAYLDGRLEIQFLEVEWNERDWQRCLQRAGDVMQCIRLGEVPGGVDLSGRNVTDLYPTDSGESVALPDDAHTLEVILAYQEAAHQALVAARIKGETRDQLIRWLGRHSVAIAAGLELYSFKQPKAMTSFNMKRFAEDHPELVEEYRESVPSGRRLHIKEGNVRKATEKVWPTKEETL